MTDGKRVSLRRIVAHDRSEIPEHQESRSIGARGRQQKRLVTIARKRLAARALNAEMLPLRDGVGFRAVGVEIVEALRHLDLVAPGLTRLPVVLFELRRRGGDDVRDIVNGVALAVAVEIHRETLERGRHELRRAERAGPRAAHLLRRQIAVMKNLQRRQKLVLEVTLTAADAGQRRGRIQHAAVTALRAVVRLDAPDRRDDVAVDAVGFLDRRKRRGVFRQHLAPLRDPRIGDQNVEIIPNRLGELGLRIHQVHDAQVRRQIGGEAAEACFGDAAPMSLRPETGDAAVEIRGRAADGVRRH